MADGFLSRWSRRKSGQPDEVVKQDQELAKSTIELVPEVGSAPAQLSLDDVEKIDALAPDFSAFMNPNVDPQVQQAALKKMFTDPHFNVMDRLDIYIDDYSQPDPLPIGMLERMAQSEMLNLSRKVEADSQELINSAGSKVAITESDVTAIEATSQTDLTSSQPPSSAKTADLDAVPLASDQKKT